MALMLFEAGFSEDEYVITEGESSNLKEKGLS